MRLDPRRPILLCCCHRATFSDSPGRLFPFPLSLLPAGVCLPSVKRTLWAAVRKRRPLQRRGSQRLGPAGGWQATPLAVLLGCLNPEADWMSRPCHSPSFELFSLVAGTYLVDLGRRLAGIAGADQRAKVLLDSNLSCGIEGVPSNLERFHIGASWERDHLGRLSKRAGRPRSQDRAHPIENCHKGEKHLRRLLD